VGREPKIESWSDLQKNGRAKKEKEGKGETLICERQITFEVGAQKAKGGGKTTQTHTPFMGKKGIKLGQEKEKGGGSIWMTIRKLEHTASHGQPSQKIRKKKNKRGGRKIE